MFLDKILNLHCTKTIIAVTKLFKDNLFNEWNVCIEWNKSHWNQKCQTIFNIHIHETLKNIVESFWKLIFLVLDVVQPTMTFARDSAYWRIKKLANWSLFIRILGNNGHLTKILKDCLTLGYLDIYDVEWLQDHCTYGQKLETPWFQLQN